jgi:hypothetical protein
VAFTSKSRAPHRTLSDPWSRMAGEMAVVADLGAQAAAAARRHDANALGALIDRIRVGILDAIKLHSTSREYLGEESQP